MGLDPKAVRAILARRQMTQPRPHAKRGEGKVGAAKRTNAYAVTFSAWCRAVGLQEPVPEYRFHPERKWRFDFAWPDKKVALEIQGGIWVAGFHSGGTGQYGDMEKLNEAAAMRWAVLQVEPRKICTAKTAELLRSVLSKEG